MSDAIGRRGFLGGIAGMVAGLFGRPAAGGGRAIRASVTTLKPMAIRPEQLINRSDMTVAIRNFYVNRNPLLARLPWVPTDRADFAMFGGRDAPISSIAGYPADFVPNQAVETFRFPSIASEYDPEELLQLQDMVDDAEVTLYYGTGDGVGRLGGKTRGLRTILAANRISRSREGDVPLAFFEDAIGRAKRGGGAPDLMLVSADCTTNPVLSLRRADAGETLLGTPIVCLKSDAIPGVAFIECPLLRWTTAVALTSKDICVRNKDVPRYIGRPGAGEWACPLAIDVANADHHCWAEATVEKGDL